MRGLVDPKLTTGRIREGVYGSPESFGLTGAFKVFCPITGRYLGIFASGDHQEDWTASGLLGEPWEHVSVSLPGKPKLCPCWAEMDWVKALFWEPEETVIQFHPASSEKINHHAGCLHLWKPPYPLPLPPGITIGPLKEAPDAP